MKIADSAPSALFMTGNGICNTGRAPKGLLKQNSFSKTTLNEPNDPKDQNMCKLHSDEVPGNDLGSPYGTLHRLQ